MWAWCVSEGGTGKERTEGLPHRGPGCHALGASLSKNQTCPAAFSGEWQGGGGARVAETTARLMAANGRLTPRHRPFLLTFYCKRLCGGCVCPAGGSGGFTVRRPQPVIL